MSKPPFKIAFVTHNLARGGAPIFLLELVRALRGQGQPLMVISEMEGPLRPEFETLGAPTFILPRSGFMELALVWKLVRLFHRERVDLVHLNNFTSYYKYGALAGRLLRLPVVWSIREDVRSKRCQRLYGWIDRLATCIMPCTHEIAKNLDAVGAHNDLVVVHDGISNVLKPGEAPDLRSMLEIPATSRIIGCVAALEPRKGIKELVLAFARLRKQGVNAHLVCIGEDRSIGHFYRPMLVETIAQLGLTDQVHLTGGRADAAGFYRQFDFLVLPTYWEGISRVLLEAMQAGCPVVATHAGGNSELIEDGKGGVLVKPGDIGGLAEAMNKLLNDPAMAARFSVHSLAVLENRFTLDRQVEKVRNVYHKLLTLQGVSPQL